MSSQESVNTSQAIPQQADLDTELEQLLPDMPESQRQQLATLFDSTDNPNSDFKQEFIDSLQKLEAITQSDSQVKAHLPEETSEATLAKEVAKLEQGQSILEAEQQEGAELFYAMFGSMVNSEPCDDIEEIRKFANAATLADAFAQEGEQNLTNILHEMPKESTELVHAAIACQLAGMTKPAKLLFKLFTQRQFIDANEGYQSLQTNITKQKGAIETAKHHSKKGENSRHANNRKRKEFAIGLFKEKPYKNPKQATERLFPTINDYANAINHPFTSDYQGFQTVYRWFLAVNKTIE
ncbi:hypothetical protein [Shewanella atlantica]|uniref:hypothetical protein n=1 Tax=Shewanella atlantica TaxID=271099 RepID=UPI003736E79D